MSKNFLDFDPNKASIKNIYRQFERGQTLPSQNMPTRCVDYLKQVIFEKKKT